MRAAYENGVWVVLWGGALSRVRRDRRAVVYSTPRSGYVRLRLRETGELVDVRQDEVRPVQWIERARGVPKTSGRGTKRT